MLFLHSLILLTLTTNNVCTALSIPHHQDAGIPSTTDLVVMERGKLQRRAFPGGAIAASLVGTGSSVVGNTLSSVGIGTVFSGVFSIFGAIGAAKRHREMMRKLQEIQDTLNTIAGKIDLIQSEIMDLDIDVGLINPSESLNEVEAKFATLCTTIQHASLTRAEFVSHKLSLSADDAYKNAYSYAREIFSTFMRGAGSSGGTPILKQQWESQLNKTPDAMDLYSAIKGFSVRYQVGLKKSAALLQFAAAFWDDPSMLGQVKEILGWVKEWDQYLEDGPNPLLPRPFTNFVRVMAAGSQNGTQPMQAANLAWTTADGNQNVRGLCDKKELIVDGEYVKCVYTIKRDPTQAIYTIDIAPQEDCHRGGTLWSTGTKIMFERDANSNPIANWQIVMDPTTNGGIFNLIASNPAPNPVLGSYGVNYQSPPTLFFGIKDGLPKAINGVQGYGFQFKLPPAPATS